ncbi:MAG: phosphoglucosamine mutase [Candidatus Micrarchaeia archaeon]
MFGTSGIRGRVSEEITPELFFRIGSAIGKDVVVGRDTRKTSFMLESALIAGILCSGHDVSSVGIAPTPTVALAAKKRKEYGAVITASHNPPEYNGLKIVDGLGKEISREEERRISALAEKGVYYASYEKVGDFEVVDNAVDEHIDTALSFVDVEKIEKKKPLVVIDCGNGAGSVITPYVLRKAGCRVLSVNSEVSGYFNRQLEPTENSLQEMRSVVVSSGADIGIGHDGDADRAVAVDERGEMIGLDRQLALMCRRVLRNSSGKIITTVEASLCVREAVEDAGGKIEITPVGSVRIAERLLEKGGIFGGEPCGEYIFPNEILVPDGVLTALKLVEMVCEEGKASKLKSEIRAYPIKREKYPCRKKEEAMEKIVSEIEVFEGEVNREDGIRIDEDGWWMLIRPSGTEPVIRLTCEAKDKKKLEEIFGKADRIVRRCCLESGGAGGG